MNRRNFLKALGLFAGAVLTPVNLKLLVMAPVSDKIALIKALMANALDSHDRMIEEAIFGESSKKC